MTGPTFAPARAAAAAAPPRPAPARPGRSPADGPGYPVLAWLRLHALTILFCGTLLGSALAYTAWELLPSEYESYALLRVASAPYSVANQTDPNRSKTDFATYLKTNAQLIKYEFVLAAALRQPASGQKEDTAGPRVADVATLKAQPDPMKYLDEKLLVAWQDGSEVIRVSMKGHAAGDVQKIVNAVQAAYMAEVIESEVKERTAFLTLVETSLDSLTKVLTTKAGVPPVVAGGGIRQADHRDPAPVVLVPPVPPEQVRKAMTQLLIQQVAGLRQAVDQLPAVIATYNSRAEGIKKQIDAMAAEPPPKEIVADVENDPGVRELALKAAIFRARYNHDKAAYNDPTADSVTASKVEADRADAAMKKLKDQKVADRTATYNRARSERLIAQYDDAVRLAREAAERLAVDKQKLGEREADLAKLPPDPVKEAEKHEAEKKGPLVDPTRTDLLAHDDIYRSMTLFAAKLRLDQASPRRMSVLQTASTPTQKDAKKQVLGTLAAGLFGFFAVAVGCLGYEVRVRKVSSLADAGATPAAVLGVVPWSPAGGSNGDAVYEAVDRLRAAVAQQWLARGAATVAVTSPLADEGKAFTAYALAESLTRGGYRTLLADFDLKHPSLHARAGVPNAVGVCELLRGDADMRATIQALPSGLHLLTAGTWSEEAKRAAGGGAVEALLARLREPFDCVVIHAHALLTSAETVEVARRCDAILVCALYRDTRLPLLKRATDRAAAMAVPHAGVVYLGATAEEALC